MLVCTIFFLDSPEPVLAEFRRVLHPGGRLAIATQPGQPCRGPRSATGGSPCGARPCTSTATSRWPSCSIGRAFTQVRVQTRGAPACPRRAARLGSLVDLAKPAPLRGSRRRCLAIRTVARPRKGASPRRCRSRPQGTTTGSVAPRNREMLHLARKQEPQFHRTPDWRSPGFAGNAASDGTCEAPPRLARWTTSRRPPSRDRRSSRSCICGEQSRDPHCSYPCNSTLGSSSGAVTARCSYRLNSALSSGLGRLLLWTSTGRLDPPGPCSGRRPLAWGER
jgi:hypothetical protein